MHQFLQFSDNLWVHHVILKGCPMLNLATNLNICLIFGFFLVNKRTNFCASFGEKSPILLRVQKKIHRNSFKKRQQMSFDIQHQFQNSTTCPNDMSHTSKRNEYFKKWQGCTNSNVNLELF